ncbi:hypothetical protein KAX03_03200 [Candidatus Bathyarchaeota archaeon]|nr:hypothetical protein [Candidatus Bathyarchaeota archaeon]
MILKKGRIIVLDTTALVMGYNPLSVDKDHFTVPDIMKELVPETLTWSRFNTALETGKIQLKTPTAKFLKIIDDCSNVTGDSTVLSNVDKQILALALELKTQGTSPLIVSDDYAVQNTADQLDLEYTSLSTFGISYRFKWILYCPACFRRYRLKLAGEKCRVCGTPLKRRVLKKISISKKRFKSFVV